jgi:hypothetical protein
LLITRLSTFIAVLALLNACASTGLADIHELEKYEGMYQRVGKKDPRCAYHQFAQVTYDSSTSNLSVEPLDDQGRQGGWGWLEFGPLNAGAQPGNAFFTMSEHHKFVANRTGNGWQVQELKKECNLRFFCGGWYSQNLIFFTDQTFHVGPLDDSQKCTYR